VLGSEKRGVVVYFKKKKTARNFPIPGAILLLIGTYPIKETRREREYYSNAGSLVVRFGSRIITIFVQWC